MLADANLARVTPLLPVFAETCPFLFARNVPRVVEADCRDAADGQPVVAVCDVGVSRTAPGSVAAFAACRTLDVESRDLTNNPFGKPYFYFYENKRN